MLAGGLLALYPLPPPAAHRSPGEEQVERRRRRARSSWTLARIPQKRLFQDLSTWTQFRELSSRSLARDSLPLLPVVLNGKYQTPFVGSRPLPSITVTQLHLPTAALHPPWGDLHTSMPLNLEGPSFSILKTPTQKDPSQSHLLCIGLQVSALCLHHMHTPAMTFPTAASLPSTYMVSSSPRM